MKGYARYRIILDEDLRAYVAMRLEVSKSIGGVSEGQARWRSLLAALDRLAVLERQQQKRRRR